MRLRKRQESAHIRSTSSRVSQPRTSFARDGSARSIGTSPGRRGVIRAKKMGPFIVASDRTGACLFERENAKIAANLKKVYEGTKPAVLKRLGETDDRSDEMIG